MYTLHSSSLTYLEARLWWYAMSLVFGYRWVMCKGVDHSLSSCCRLCHATEWFDLIRCAGLHNIHTLVYYTSYIGYIHDLLWCPSIPLYYLHEESAFLPINISVLVNIVIIFHSQLLFQACCLLLWAPLLRSFLVYYCFYSNNFARLILIRAHQGASLQLYCL